MHEPISTFTLKDLKIEMYLKKNTLTVVEELHGDKKEKSFEKEFEAVLFYTTLITDYLANTQLNPQLTPQE